MTAAGNGRRGITDLTRLKSALDPAGRTGSIIFCRISQYRQLVKDIHIALSRTAVTGIVNAINKTHQVDSNAGST